MRSIASAERRVRKSSGVASAPTTSAAARLAHERSASLQSVRRVSVVSIARTATTCSAEYSSMPAGFYAACPTRDRRDRIARLAGSPMPLLPQLGHHIVLVGGGHSHV